MTPKSQLLAQFPELLQGFSSRTTRPELTDPVFVKQVHGNAIYKVSDEGGEIGHGKSLPKADAIMTNKLNIPVVIKTADCVPVLFYAPKERVVAAAHAGWKGTSKKIVQEVLQAMKKEYNVDSSGVFCAIGPSICGDCYDVSTTNDGRIELFDELFNKNPQVIRRSNNKIAIDLKEANKVLLQEMGVPDDQIEVSPICTFENPQVWPSYRRTPRDLEYQIWSYIMLK